MATPTFKNPLIENLVNAFLKGGDRQFLMKGANMLPTNRQMLELAEKRLEMSKEQLVAIQKDIADQELLISLARVIFKVADGAEGDDLVEWHEER